MKTTVKKAKKKEALMPSGIEPMLCSIATTPAKDDEFVHEVKFDGYRIIAEIQEDKVTLRSRGGLDYTRRYPAIVNALKYLNIQAILDGEVIVTNDRGQHDFNLVENYNGSGQGSLQFYVFDILWLQGKEVISLALIERKQLLFDAIQWNDTLKYVDHYEDGAVLFQQVQKFGFEGVVSKKKDSIYTPGKRSKYWLKVKHKKTEEYIFVGYVEANSATLFRTTLLAQYVNSKLTYIHHSGGGFTDKQKLELYKEFQGLVIKKPLVVNPDDVDVEGEITWIKPQIVGQFEQENLTTKSGKIRHPVIYKGRREDKQANEVTAQEPTINSHEELPNESNSKASGSDKKAGSDLGVGSWEMVEKRPITSTNELDIEGKPLSIVNIEKSLWHDVTKGDLINYYIQVAPFILPYLKDRPMALNVSLHGPYEDSFFLRGLEGHYPSWANVFKTERKHKKKGKSDYIEWLVCNDLATLIYITNLECIDIHPWNSRTTSPNTPDYIAIDLDPSDDDFKKAIETAKAAKIFFDKHKLKSFVKTSGKTGLHLFLPCTGIEFGQARKIAEHVCQEIHLMLPDITTMVVSKNSRGDKLYVDPSQNDYADRLAVAYCCRPNVQPTVSTPLEWKEVTTKLSPFDFTVQKLNGRLTRKGDVWAGMFDKKTALANSPILSGFL